MTFARKINKIPEFYTIFARKMPELARDRTPWRSFVSSWMVFDLQ